ncbi:MAG: NADAR family protein [Desulfovibrio sp.]|nr:NADAR family protein [Desulfovibrio sp.]MBR5051315.1 NADAR family protein [Desulfovibrio sp.]
MKIICFHNPDEENGYLSNWFHSKFKIHNCVFTSIEQYMMYKKAECFKDANIASKIMNTNDVSQIKKFGRQVDGYNETVWNGMRQLIVYDGLFAKFTQNEELKIMLLQTECSVLAECAVKDQIWGIGLSMKNPDRLDMSKWKGKNLLGFTLMMVRSKIISRDI